MGDRSDAAAPAAVASAINDVVASGLPHGSAFDWKWQGDTIQVDLLWIPPVLRGRRLASTFMRSLCAECDRLGFWVVLAADAAQEPTAPSTEALVEWYARLGFQAVGVTRQGWPLMERKPIPAFACIEAEDHLSNPRMR